VRAALALRGLRDGLCGRDRARTAGDRDGCRRYSRGRTRRRRHSRPARQRACPCGGTPPSDNRRRRAGSARRCGARRRRATSHLGGIGRAVFARPRESSLSGFSAEGLALREPHDGRARNREVLASVAAAAAAVDAVAVVDLACGTGSTLRALSPRLPPRQDWRLVDNDLSLLARAAAGRTIPGIAVTRIPVDLTRDLEAALDGRVNLVTASALLEPRSPGWVDA